MLVSPPAGAQCDSVVESSSSDPGSFEHRWAGTEFTIHSPDGEVLWTGGDGGRIRHRNVSGAWIYQPTPLDVRGVVRRFHFLENALDGWAVTSDGWTLRTDNGGATWWTLSRMPGSFQVTEWEDLWGIWMDENGEDGLLAGLRGIWYTSDGGICWVRSVMKDKAGQLLGAPEFDAQHIEIYGLDVLLGHTTRPCAATSPQTDFLALAVAEPGYIFRSLDHGSTWDLVFHWVDDLCPVLASDSCLKAPCPGNFPPGADLIELWGVAISRHPNQPLALAVGGRGTGCGLILASTDNGCTWSMELHECQGDPSLDCTNTLLHDYDPYSNQIPRRHSNIKTLYDVAIDESDNTAIAPGYNGQHLRRDVIAGSPPTPVWRDRSTFGKHIDPGFTTHDAIVVFPLMGSTAPTGGDAFISGMGGHIRVSDDGGETWANEILGQPFRISDVFARERPEEEDEVWMAGQFLRLARSTDGGKNWTQATPFPVWNNGCHLRSITFAGDLEHGVAVGCSLPGVAADGPTIYYTDQFSNMAWSSPASVSYLTDGQTFYKKEPLRRVAWGGGTNLDFWAAGFNGLILFTTDGGANWHQLDASPIPNHRDFHIHSVAAQGGNYVTFVGQRGSQAEAWIYTIGTATWLEITPADPDITILTDAAVGAGDLYAVGQRNVGSSGVEGLVLKHDTQTQRLEVEPGPFDPDGVPECTEGGGPLPTQGINTLTRVVLDPAGNLWIAGLCGRVWERPASSSTWVEHKPQTGGNVMGLQFVTENRGYMASFAQTDVQQAVVRLNR